MNHCTTAGGLLTLLLLATCVPVDELITTDADARLTYSTDTVLFDTVFTQVGTATRRLRIYNPNARAVSISAVALGQNSSPFRIWVNGQAGPQVRNVLLRGNDSLLVLVEATLDATNQNQPLVVAGELLVSSNGRQDRVVLEAWGQDAVYVNQEAPLDCGPFTGSTLVWTKEKPYVLYNAVVVPAGCRLRVEAGARLFMHKSAVLIVLGTLELAGTPNEPVRITGTRDYTGAADRARYQNQPNQWGGIVFVNGSTGNRIIFADIRNGDRGIQVGLPNVTGDVDLRISHSLVANMASNVLWAFNPTYLTAYNNLFINGGERTLAGLMGGTYTFVHNTLAYSNTLGYVRRSPSAAFSDFFTIQTPQGDVLRQERLDVVFVSNIVSGSNDDEMEVALLQPGNAFSMFNNVVSQQDTTLVPVEGWTATNRRVRRSFNFAEATAFDFRIDSLDATSPARDYGFPLIGVTFRPGTLQQRITAQDLSTDFFFQNRTLQRPDAGAIEAP